VAGKDGDDLSSLVTDTPNRTIPSLSTEPVFVEVARQIPGQSQTDISASTVKFAFKAPGIDPNAPPNGSDWTAGSWVTDTGPIYLAEISVGPTGAVTLAKGTYVVWVYVSYSGEAPVRQCGTLTIT